jgi:Integrase core domain
MHCASIQPERVEVETVADAREKGKWFRRYYNVVRSHSSLDYATPKEFSSSCDERKTCDRVLI